VENSVEISGLSRLTAMKSLVLSVSAYGEGNFDGVFVDAFRLVTATGAFTDTSREAKVSDFHAFQGIPRATAELPRLR
jgi:hypothetical protein